MPVFGCRSHEGGGDGKHDDGGAENHCSGINVGEESDDDPGDCEDGGEGGAGERLVLDPQAGVVPVALRLGLATVRIFRIARFSKLPNRLRES